MTTICERCGDALGSDVECPVHGTPDWLGLSHDRVHKGVGEGRAVRTIRVPDIPIDPDVDAAVERLAREHDQGASVPDECSWRERAERAEAEVRKLERAAAFMPPRDCHEPLTDEAFQGIKMRWATGPERYQQDADALILGIITANRRIIALEAVAKAARAMRDEGEGVHFTRDCDGCRPLLDALDALDGAR